MADLSLPVAKFWSEVGIFLGWGGGTFGGDAAWDARKDKRIRAIVESGLRNFYVPSPMEPGGAVHEWSFLKPHEELTLDSGAASLRLPADFGYPDGTVTVTDADGTVVLHDLPLTSFALLRSKRAEDAELTGQPRLAAVEPVRMTAPARGQRWDLEVWPTADAEFTIGITYAVNPANLTGENDYAYGGAAHAETILESCLAIAEQRLDDLATASGPHSMKFRERLAASIAYDRRLKPQLVGYNGDTSDASERSRMLRDRARNGYVTFGGVLYEGD